MRGKNPTFLVSTDKVNETQRKSLGLGHYAPTYRDPKAAGPINFKSSALIGIPKMEAVRPGADDHLSIKNIGIEST